MKEQAIARQSVEPSLKITNQQSTEQPAPENNAKPLFTPTNPDNRAHHVPSTRGNKKRAQDGAPPSYLSPRPNITPRLNHRDLSILLADRENNTSKHPTMIPRGSRRYGHDCDSDSSDEGERGHQRRLPIRIYLTRVSKTAPMTGL